MLYGEGVTVKFSQICIDVTGVPYRSWGGGSGPMHRRGHRRAWFQVCVVVCLFARLPETLTDIVVKVLEYISNGCKNHALKCLDKLGQTSTSLC